MHPLFQKYFQSSFSMFDGIQTMAKVLSYGGVSCSYVRVLKEGNPIPRGSWIQEAGWWLKFISSNIWSTDLNEVLNYWIGPNFIKLKNQWQSLIVLCPMRMHRHHPSRHDTQNLAQNRTLCWNEMAFSYLYASKKTNEKLKEIKIRVLYLDKGVNHPNDIAKSYMANV